MGLYGDGVSGGPCHVRGTRNGYADIGIGKEVEGLYPYSVALKGVGAGGGSPKKLGRL